MRGDTLPHALTSISTVKVYYGTFVHQTLTVYLVPPSLIRYLVPLDTLTRIKVSHHLETLYTRVKCPPYSLSFTSVLLFNCVVYINCIRFVQSFNKGIQIHKTYYLHVLYMSCYKFICWMKTFKKSMKLSWIQCSLSVSHEPFSLFHHRVLI